MNNEDYNGYKNKPTWLVRLWIDNDMGLNETTEEQAWEFLKDNLDDESEAVRLQADYLQELIEGEDLNKLANESSLYSDLMNWALAHVDWQEAAQVDVDIAKDNHADEIKEAKASQEETK